MVALEQLVNYTNDYLKIKQFRDYCPNGLQVEGRADVKRVVSGVTASLALIDAAIEREADVLVVHHGYFWKGEE
ncbi:MAG: Nif3-like dinuclear metal center hexameric protein, partial [bacterium]